MARSATQTITIDTHSVELIAARVHAVYADEPEYGDTGGAMYARRAKPGFEIKHSDEYLVVHRGNVIGVLIRWDLGKTEFSFSGLNKRIHPEHGREVRRVLDCGTRRDVLARGIVQSRRPQYHRVPAAVFDRAA